MKFVLPFILASAAVAAAPVEVGSRWKLYGDEFEVVALDVSKLDGQAVRLRVKMKDADLHALRFAERTHFPASSCVPSSSF